MVYRYLIKIIFILTWQFSNTLAPRMPLSTAGYTPHVPAVEEVASDDEVVQKCINEC